jgi:ubiquinone biosynthesis protein Coq4
MRVMKSIRALFGYATGIKGFVSIVKDPNNTNGVFEMAEGFRDARVYQKTIAFAKSRPGCAPMFEQRYVSQTPDVDALARLPEGTLGNAFAQHLRTNNLKPDFYPEIEPNDDLAYMILRMRQTHDIWHTVTGFGTDVAGEVGLQAFGAAQLHNPLASLLVGGGLFQTLWRGGDADRVMDEVARGWRMGRTAKTFFAQRWEEGWDRPLSQWRKELNVPEA